MRMPAYRFQIGPTGIPIQQADEKGINFPQA
jgi:hypothetical protein